MVAQSWSGDTIGEFNLRTNQGWINGQQGVAENRKSDFRNTVEQQQRDSIERIKNSDYPNVVKLYLIAINDPAGPVFKASYRSYSKGNEARDQLKNIFAQKYNVDPAELENADQNEMAKQVAREGVTENTTPDHEKVIELFAQIVADDTGYSVKKVNYEIYDEGLRTPSGIPVYFYSFDGDVRYVGALPGGKPTAIVNQDGEVGSRGSHLELSIGGEVQYVIKGKTLYSAADQQKIANAKPGDDEYSLVLIALDLMWGRMQHKFMEQGVAEGKGDFAQAIENLHSWYEEESNNPDIRIWEFDDREGGYYAQGTVYYHAKTGRVKIEFEDRDGYHGGDVNDTFDSIGDAMNVLKNITVQIRPNTGKAQDFDKLGGRSVAGPDDLYKTDRVGRKGTLNKSRMDAMKTSSPYRKTGPKGQLPESGVEEATGDPKFDKMLKGITGKRQVAKQQKADTKQQARDAFGGMFGGGNPADSLGIRKKSVDEGSELPANVIDMIKKIAQSSAAPEHKTAMINALIAKYSNSGVEETYGAELHTKHKRNRFKQIKKIKQQQEKALGLSEAGCNMTESGRACSVHGMNECPGYEMTETSAQDKLHQRHQEIRKKSGLPHPDHYLKMMKQKQAEIDALRAEIESDKSKGLGEARKPDYNFDIEDIKKLERIRDLPTLKTLAFDLISKPSAKPMKPEKVEWFRSALERMDSPLKVIKLMYDLMLSGEGHQVIGSRNSMKANSYRGRFSEQEDISEDVERYVEALGRAGYDLQEEKTRLDPKCWKGYKKAGTKMKGGVRVNNCVPYTVHSFILPPSARPS
jgi:hypothetical protein